MLQAVNIAQAFDYPLYADLSLTLHEGESMAIVGVSGSGKSTLLHSLSSFLAPDSGEILYNNTDLYKATEESMLAIRRHDFGIIFQSHYLFSGFSGRENIQVSSLLAHEPIDEELIKHFSLDHVIHQNVGTLSGGQQQRLSIARVLTKKPKILFADEPTGNLDKKTADEIMNLLFDYLKHVNGSLFLVTHDHDLAQRCDTSLRLHDKKLKSETWM